MLELREGPLGLSVYARCPFEPGQFIMEVVGEYYPVRTRHTLQVDFDLHVDFPSPLRFINHSCDPNCGLVMPRGSNLASLYARRGR